MKKKKLPDFLSKALETVAEHSPDILTGFTIAGIVTTATLAVSATPEALKRIGKRKRELGVAKLDPLETIKTTWTCYIPATISAIVSGACAIGSNSIHHKRNATLMAAYTITEAALRDYKEKSLEVLNPKQIEEIQTRVAQDRSDAKPPVEDGIIRTGYGNSLFYDTISGRYFYSDIEQVKQTIHNLNMRLFDEAFISQNELFDELGLPTTGGGYELGWNAESGRIDAEYSAIIAKNGKPCITISYQVSPHFRYLSH